MKSIAVAILACVFLSVSFAWSAANFPDTIKVPVTFYDFHSDTSNPEFERTPSPPNGGLHLGMVGTKLNNERKPVLGPTPYWDCYIDKWFVPWKSGDFTIPNYTTPTATTNCSNGKSTVTYDTAFINKVIQDTLVFRLVSGSQGTYSFTDATFFPLDNRGFGSEGKSHNFSFSMELHWEFTYVRGLTFNFQGDDDVWAFIDGSLAMDIGGIHGATQGSFAVDSLGLDTTLTKHKFDFFYCERHITQSTIQITTNIISLAPTILEMKAVPDSSIPAGDSVILTANVFDDTGGARSEFNPLVEWTLIPGKAGSKNTLRVTKGDGNTFYGITAYEYDTIITKFVDPKNAQLVLRDTVIIRVTPGPPYKIVIESDTAISDSNKTNPLAFLTMDSAANFDTVYAIVYDKYDNYSGLARSASWTSLNTGLVTVNGVVNRLYAGAFHRETKEKDSTYIVASQTGLVSDSLHVFLQTGNIIAIRLVTVIGDTVIDAITINTDQQKNVKIQVQWSNAPGVWVDGTGSWTLTPDTIKWDAPQPPTAGSEAAAWTLNPKTPGQCNLKVAAGIRSKIVPVTIAVAPPSKVSIRIITSPDSIVAGRTFRALVQIENTDGLVPGEWCVDATYHDSIDNSKRPDYTPSIILASKTSSSTGFDATTDECFMNGVDILQVKLYYAPFKEWITNDSLHLFTVALSGNGKVVGRPTSSTDRFRLFPGPLDSISLEDANMAAMPGPLTLTYPTGMAIIYSNGFDDFGNRIDHIPSDWSRNGTLHPITPPDSGVFRIIYQAGSTNESGYLLASVLSELRPGFMLWDSVQIINNGSDAVIDSAVTRDVSGNGYLDQIVIFFNKNVSVPQGFDPASNVRVVYDKAPFSAASPFVFIVDSIAVISGASTIATVYLMDTNTLKNGIVPKNAIPQTKWLPLISINGLVGASPISNQRCIDGAGPVIWRVVVDRKSATDYSKDVVTVTFSEAIKSGKTGDSFITNVFPDSVFNVFKIYSVNSITHLDTDKIKLSNIPTFDQLSADGRALNFYMSNGLELMDYNYFNITNKNYISDASRQGFSILPGENNQKVRVEITGNYGEFIAGPNPAIPTFNHVPAGIFYFKNEPEAINWAKNGEGTVLRIQLSQGQGTITGHLNIYDVVGNLVTSTSRDQNLLDERTGGPVSSADTTSLFNYDIYWNCTNSKGMKAAPGVYLVVLYLTAVKPDGAKSPIRKSLLLGIKR